MVPFKHIWAHVFGGHASFADEGGEAAQSPFCLRDLFGAMQTCNYLLNVPKDFSQPHFAWLFPLRHKICVACLSLPL